jgi:hypothetical protein
MAVGTGGPSGLLAERWDGARWVIVPAPRPPPVPVPGSGTLAGVSCASAASCAAVGWQFTTAPTSRVPLAEHWDGGSWSAQPVPSPVFHGQGSELAAVSCTSSRTCTAVGERGSVPSATLAERWDGRRWAVQPTPSPHRHDTHLLGVDCTSAASCIAAGLDSPPARLLALAEHWNGARWARQHTPPPAPGAGGVQLDGIGCSPAACTAVGQAGSDAVPPVIERWNGTTWLMQRSPPMRNPGPGQLTSVSCPAATVCFAAGNTGGSGPPNFQAFALAERWNGKTWAIQRLPEPPGTLSSYLNGISCSSPVACTAAGEAVLGLPAGTVTLAERWDGTRWAIQHTPNPRHSNLSGAATATLNAVSCPSATTCVAVGRSDSGTLAELWNGTTWAIQHLPG